MLLMNSQISTNNVFRFINGLLDTCQLNSFERLQTQVEEFMCEGKYNLVASQLDH